MKRSKQFVAALLLISASVPALGENRSADNCQIFIKKVGASPSSHGSLTINAVVKVGWIGGDEHIQRVGFYGHVQAIDRGNSPECRMGPTYNDPSWRVYEPLPGHYYATEYGEYGFYLPIYSGSVLSQCPGYHYSWVGAFFVETNKNTYWLNPDLTPSQHYHFDRNAARILQNQLGTANMGRTNREFLRYYNPLLCE
jgi:hypothetical protein